KEQGLFHDANTPEATYSDTLELDLATVEPSLAGPSRPQDRVALSDVKTAFAEALPNLKAPFKKPLPPTLPMAPTTAEAFGGGPVGAFGAKTSPEVPSGALGDGSVVIAAITSCTNTSNPSVMIAA